MTISTVDGLIAAFPGQSIAFLKTYPALQAAGQWYSPWLLAGIPGAGTAPSSGVAGATLTDADAGGVPFTNAASGVMYLGRFAANSAINGVLMLYDRLWQNSGLSATLLTAQTVNSVTLPARCPVASDTTGETFDTSGNKVEAWLQVMTVLGAGSTAPTISYTDEAGNAGATGTLQNFVTTAAVGRTFPFSLAAGDNGVRSIQSYTNGATMTSGAFSLILRRRLLTVLLAAASMGDVLDWAQVAMPAIAPDSHLELIFIPNATTAATILADGTIIGG